MLEAQRQQMMEEIADVVEKYGVTVLAVSYFCETGLGSGIMSTYSTPEYSPDEDALGINMKKALATYLLAEGIVK